MECPKCQGLMQEKVYGSRIKIKRCENCQGLFIRPEMLEDMLDEWMSDVLLDTGSVKVGRHFDRVDDIDCPACHIRMDKIVDEKQTHIWLESCSECDGLFFDAGEFTDLKYVTILDFFRDILKGKRPVD